MQQRKTPAFFVFSCNLQGLDRSPETRFPDATLPKTAPLWGPNRDKYSQSLWVMKTAWLTTLGNSLSDSLWILFLGWSESVRSDKLRTLRASNGSREYLVDLLSRSRSSWQISLRRFVPPTATHAPQFPRPIRSEPMEEVAPVLQVQSLFASGSAAVRKYQCRA